MQTQIQIQISTLLETNIHSFLCKIGVEQDNFYQIWKIISQCRQWNQHSPRPFDRKQFQRNEIVHAIIAFGERLILDTQEFWIYFSQNS